MEKVIEKLKEDISDSFVSLGNSMGLSKDNEKSLQSAFSILERMLKFIELKESEYDKNFLFFEDFDVLSAFLETRPYKDLEKYKIIKFIITKNIKVGLNERCAIVDNEKIIDFPFENLTQEEVISILDGEREKYVLTGVGHLTKKERILREQILEHLEELKIDSTNLIKASNNVLNDYFVNKEDNYTLEDIEIIVENLCQLELTEPVISAIRRVLEKRYYKNNKKEETTKCEKYVYSSKEKTKYLSDEEYKILLKKLKAVYDPYNMELKKEVSYEEMMELVSIMVKLGYSESEVNLFVKHAKKSFQNESIEIKTFIENYERYIYYLGSDIVTPLLEYLQEMMIPKEEEYKDWKEIFLSELTKVDKMIENKQGYEYQRVKKI